MTPQEYIAGLESYIESVKEQIVKANSECVVAVDEINHVTKELAEAKENLAIHLKEYGIEKNAVDEQLSLMKRESEKLTTEVEVLVARKGELQIANEQLQSQNKHFREYEAKATKVLRTVEESLIQREKALQQREQFKSNKSILPPLS